MTDEALIAEAGRRLAVAAPGARVILFGSRARGEAHSDSDLDLLVIEPDEVTKRRAETARLRRELRGLEIALDVMTRAERRRALMAPVITNVEICGCTNEALERGDTCGQLNCRI